MACGSGAPDETVFHRGASKFLEAPPVCRIHRWCLVHEAKLKTVVSFNMCESMSYKKSRAEEHREIKPCFPLQGGENVTLYITEDVIEGGSSRSRMEVVSFP